MTSPHQPRSRRRRNALRLPFSVLLATAVVAAPAPRPAAASDPAGATVQVVAQVSPPDWASPWQRTGVQSVAGSGVVLEGGRILTNAHVVADAVSVEVKRSGRTRRFTAAVEHVCHPCDLALLTVAEEGFLEGVEPLALGGLPRLEDKVQVYGFPVGGETVSVSSGVVSRIEVGTYAHSLEDLLMIQIDAAVNPGNSGGPVLVDGKLVGVASQYLEEAENIGYIIPVPVVRHFLDDVADGGFDGFPRLGVELQPVGSAVFSEYLGVGKTPAGGMVARVNFGSPAWGVLEPGDVLLRIGDRAVAEDLTVELSPGRRVWYGHLVRSRQMGESLDLALVRQGNLETGTVILKPWRPLVPGYRQGAGSWYMFGGLVFQPLSAELLASLEDDSHPGMMRYYTDENVVTPSRQQVVVISHVLADEVNKGFDAAAHRVVVAVDRKPVSDLRQMISLIEGGRFPFLRLETEDGYVVVMRRDEARRAGDGIVSRHGLPADRSADLKP
jgi:S1-C subfamily serine protease